MAGRGAKICSSCSLELPLTRFSKNGTRSQDRRHSKCKQCRARDQREAYDYQQQRERNLKYKHGLSLAEFDLMLAKQGWACAVCKRETPGWRGNVWHIDHDHSCCPKNHSCDSCRRGLLCHPCNTALGNAGDSIERLKQMIDYLEEAAK